MHLPYLHMYPPYADVVALTQDDTTHLGSDCGGFVVPGNYKQQLERLREEWRSRVTRSFDIVLDGNGINVAPHLSAPARRQRSSLEQREDGAKRKAHPWRYRG